MLNGFQCEGFPKNRNERFAFSPKRVSGPDFIAAGKDK